MFNKILVAVDGSSTAGRGLKTAVSLAINQDATLIILHVVDERTPVIYPEAGLYADQIIASLRDNGRKIIAAAQREASRQVVKAQTRMVETLGLPVAEVIAREAKRLRADLIVLGTHGRQGLKRVVMGSDAEGVVRLANVPVLLVRSPVRAPRKTSRR